jgi:hypothetical protein
MVTVAPLKIPWCRLFLTSRANPGNCLFLQRVKVILTRVKRVLQTTEMLQWVGHNPEESRQACGRTLSLHAFNLKKAETHHEQ